MMKLIGGVVVLLLVVGAVWMWQNKGGDTPSTALNANETETPSEPEAMGLLEQGKKAVTSIRDAMQLGTEMQCSFSSGEGETAVTSTVYVAGQRFLTTAMVGSVKTNALFDGETQYVWTDGSVQGMKLTKACLESMKTESTKTNVPPKDYQKEFDMAKNVHCEPAATGAVSMEVPANVTFTDQCAMMQDSLKMMEQVKGKLPAGMEIPSVPNMAY